MVLLLLGHAVTAADACSVMLVDCMRMGEADEIDAVEGLVEIVSSPLTGVVETEDRMTAGDVEMLLGCGNGRGVDAGEADVGAASDTGGATVAVLMVAGLEDVAGMTRGTLVLAIADALDCVEASPSLSSGHTPPGSHGSMEQQPLKP